MYGFFNSSIVKAVAGSIYLFYHVGISRMRYLVLSELLISNMDSCLVLFSLHNATSLCDFFFLRAESNNNKLTNVFKSKQLE